jgi:hypothetical protein
VIDFGLHVHHAGEAAYKSGQALAVEVAKRTCPACTKDHIDRVARILSVADTVGRFVVSIGAEAAFHPLGGVVASTVAGKTAWFIPAASACYVAAKLAAHTVRGGDPLKLIREARAAVRQAKLKVSRTGHVKPRRVEHALGGDQDRAAAADLLRIFSQAEDPDRVEALLAAALDESGMDLKRAVELARVVLDVQTDQAEQGPTKAQTKGGPHRVSRRSDGQWEILGGNGFAVEVGDPPRDRFRSREEAEEALDDLESGGPRRYR